MQEQVNEIEVLRIKNKEHQEEVKSCYGCCCCFFSQTQFLLCLLVLMESLASYLPLLLHFRLKKSWLPVAT